MSRFLRPKNLELLVTEVIVVLLLYYYFIIFYSCRDLVAVVLKTLTQRGLAHATDASQVYNDSKMKLTK